MTLKQSIPLQLMLVAGSAWLVYANYQTWSAEPDLTDLPAAQAESERDSLTRDQGMRREARPKRSSFLVVSAKNLFHPERREIAEADSEEDTQRKESSDYTLVGTMILDNGESFAYLMYKDDDAARRYYENETLGGYRLAAIEPTQVYLRKGNEELVVKCFTGESRSKTKTVSPRRSSNDSNSKSRRDYLRERRLRKARERAKRNNADD